MTAKLATMAAVACALGLAMPATVQAGGEIQQYGSPAPAQAYGTYAPYANGAYGVPAAAYARPVGMYYGSACNTCGPQPYGYSTYPAAGAGFGMRNDVLTAGLLGIGIGYLLFH